MAMDSESEDQSELAIKFLDRGSDNPGALKHVGVRHPVLDHGHVMLVDYMGSDARVEAAARLSYQKGTRKVSETAGLIRYLMRHRHTTPFEKVRFEFDVKLPIFVARQWMRHRTGSYNEYSLRYSEAMDEMFTPRIGTLTKQDQKNRQGGGREMIDTPKAAILRFECGQETAKKDYDAFLGMDLRRELARINLPLAQYTQFWWTVDLHNLFHFLSLRMDDHAQEETRAYANVIASIVADAVPLCWRAFIDYRLAAQTFSLQELKVLSHFMTKSAWNIADPADAAFIEACIPNKRERDEFIVKLGYLIAVADFDGEIPL